MQKKSIPPDIIGQRFGRWKVIGYSSKQSPISRRYYFDCRCECGTERPVLAPSLLNGKSVSCGCYRGEQAARAITKHGQSGNHLTSEYRAFRSMHRRCNDKSQSQYKDYGGRGISVCERWSSFQNFLDDMGPRPSPNHSIDRFPDKNGNYEPGNVRWATRQEQNNNKRSCLYITFNGETKTIAQWARLYNKIPQTVGRRLKLGWSIEDALTTPVRS